MLTNNQSMEYYYYHKFRYQKNKKKKKIDGICLFMSIWKLKNAFEEQSTCNVSFLFQMRRFSSKAQGSYDMCREE